MSTSSDQSSENEESAEVQAPEAAETSTGSGTGDQANGRNCEADNRLLEAEAIVHRNTLWAFSAGILPLPIFDVVALSGVQFKMIKELSTLYRLQFTEGMVKKSVTSLLVGVGGVGIGGVLGTSMFKYVPVIGQALGMVSTPVVAGALTHAVGKAFIMHFEAGGTLLDFDPKAMRSYFESEYKKAKHTVADMSHSVRPPAPEASPGE
ncbi:MAG: DUF697 domain-containing protein [Myxococcales bacterium]|nr:DUF697 domain-containing protein [Myxococcales bacterium]